MLDRDTIHTFLQSLNKYLSRLNKEDAHEVIKEIESHIYDVIEWKESNNAQIDVQQILNGFGSPRELAAQYVEHIMTGSPPPKGFKAIQKLKTGITKGIWYSMAIFCYGVAGLFGLIGIAKILFPEKIGLWMAAEGNSIIITFSEHSLLMSEEKLGWWLVPVSLAACLIIFWLSKRVLEALKTSLV